MTSIINKIVFVHIISCIFSSNDAFFIKEKETLYDILDAPMDATNSVLKKSYRSLSLKFHPDKLGAYMSTSNITQNCNVQDFLDNDNVSNNTELEHFCTNDDVDILKDFYLNVQNAYEILTDSNKRLKYDLSLKGEDFDYPDSFDDEDNDDVYTNSAIFRTFMKSPHFKLYISINNRKSYLPDVNLRLKVDLSRSMENIEFIDYTYYRRKVCSVCQGKGATEWYNTLNFFFFF